MKNVMWIPSDDSVKHSNMHSFMQFVMEKYNLKLDNYGDLYRWSIKSKENFWQAIWRYFDIKYI